MKKIGKHGTYAILGLVGVSLLGVGFSSWMINASTQTTAANNVTVSAGDFSDKRFDFKITEKTDTTVKFDSVAGDSDTIKGDAGQEDLNFTIKCSIKNTGTTATDLVGIFVKFEDAGTSKIGDLVTNKYIQTPVAFGTDSSDSTNGTYGYNVLKGSQLSETTVEESYTNPASAKKFTFTVAENEENGTYDITMTFNFAWGESFNYDNPANANSSDSHYNSTIEGLKALSAADSLALNVTLTAVANTTQNN